MAVDVADLDSLLIEVVATPEGRADPYSRYAALRNGAPVFRSSLGIWVCTRFDDCQFVLRDHRFGKATDEDAMERANARFGANVVTPEQAEYLRSRRSLLFMNPPDHTRLRGLVSKGFTPRTVDALRPAISDLVDDLLAQVPDGEEFDLIATLAFPLPVAVIGRMLGVPEIDWPRFQQVMRDATVLLEPMIPPDQLERALVARRELDVYFSDLVAERRRVPADDLISRLIEVEEGTDKLTEVELISTAVLIFGAGFETTTNLIGNGTLSLLRNPDQLDRLRSDRPGLLRSAVDELLRYESPVQLDGREAFEPNEVAGCEIEKGDTVLTLLGAANRDPNHFEDPDRLDLGRDEGPPLSFGSGIHYCLGAALARVEGQVYLDRLLDTFESIELATDNPMWKDRITLRGLAELPLVARRG